MIPSVKIHDVLLAADEADAQAAISRDPSLAGRTIILRESSLYGLMIGEWAITERAAANMRNLPRMVAYLRGRAAVTEAARARGEIR